MNTRPEQQRVMTLIAIALTFGSGAMDVTSFTRLGNVFTSVMTGNIVLWGLAAARGSATLASHSTVAIAGYIAGVAAATWIAHGFTGKADAGKPGDGKPGDGKPGDGKPGDRRNVSRAFAAGPHFLHMAPFRGARAGRH